MITRRKRGLFATLSTMLVLIMLVSGLSACGAQATATPAPTAAPVVTTAPAPTTAPAATEAPAATTAPAATEAPASTAAPAATAVATQASAASASPDVLTGSKAAKIDWQQFKGTTLNALVVKHWWTDAITPLLPQFEELTGIKVKFDTYSEDTYFQKAATELSSKSSAHDVLMVGNLQVGQYMGGGWLEPLDGYFNNSKLSDLQWYDMEDMLKPGRDAGSKDGRQYALPIGSEAEMLMYRKDIFQEKGLKPPTTYDELYKAAKQLNSADMAGYVTRGKRGLDVLWEWTGFLLSYGGRYFDDTGKPAFNSPEGIAATDMYVKLLKETGPEGTLNWSWMEASQNFAQGKSAMYVEAGGIGPVVDKSGSGVAGKVGYALLPHVQGKEAIPDYWFWMIGIPAGSKNKDAAYLFLEWATSKTLGIPLSMGGSSPARASVWNSKEILSWANPEWAKISLDSLKLVQPKLVPYDRADFPEITDAISAEINNVQAGSKGSKTAMDDAAAQVEKIVSQK